MLTNSNSKSKEIEFDTIDEALAWHDGDPLLKDCGFLRQQLDLVIGALSDGMTRGWMSKIERSE